MDDREMLEWAAKAAGYLVCRPFRNGEFRVSGQDGLSFAWNPRDDDGDALRLAVRVGIFSTTEQFRDFQAFYSDEIRKDGKPTSATRRAILYIAALQGKSNR